MCQTCNPRARTRPSKGPAWATASLWEHFKGEGRKAGPLTVSSSDWCSSSDTIHAQPRVTAVQQSFPGFCSHFLRCGLCLVTRLLSVELVCELSVSRCRVLCLFPSVRVSCVQVFFMFFVPFSIYFLPVSFQFSLASVPVFVCTFFHPVVKSCPNLFSYQTSQGLNMQLNFYALRVRVFCFFTGLLGRSLTGPVEIKWGCVIRFSWFRVFTYLSTYFFCGIIFNVIS